MPLIANSDYRPPLLFRNKHINTIFPAIFRKVKCIPYQRFRIDTNDNDFIDFDLSLVNSRAVAVIVHGLEGNSQKPYIKGMVNACNEIGIDAISVNLRGCGAEPNRLFTSYHSGKTDDLNLIVNYANRELKYMSIILIGFSLGGNITLKYIGESGTKLPEYVKLAIGISVPCDLKSSAVQLSKLSNWIYLKRFMHSLKKKALFKIQKFNELSINKEGIQRTSDFLSFDNIFTAPVHGFENAENYYDKCSSRQFLSFITIPALLINAKDDPFLGYNCFPYKEAESNSNFYFETPRYGGHVGFILNYNFSSAMWHEIRVKQFISEKLKFL